jgi:hypothetical protein
LICHTAGPFHSVDGRISVVLARSVVTPNTSRPGQWRTRFAGLRLDENVEMVMTGLFYRNICSFEMRRTGQAKNAVAHRSDRSDYTGLPGN